MDVSDYLPMFLAEAREHLQTLNLAVVRVEEDPNDRETVDEIFRGAHSLKGMAATMGFASIAALTHEMENVFELLRERRGGLEREAIDVLLECLDVLEGAVDAIDADGVEKLAPEQLIARLQQLVRARDAAPEADEASVSASAEPCVHVHARFADDAPMPAVRAYQLLAALGDLGTVLRSVPDADALDDFGGQAVDAWLQTDVDTEMVEATARNVPDFAEVTVGDQRDVEVTAVTEAETARADHAKKPQSSTVRVDAERLDLLMHLMGELVVHRTQVESLALQATVPGLAQAVQDLTRSSQALQTMVMQVRMIPVDAVFLRFPRLVRDLSTKLDKKVELTLDGRETELDRTVVDALGDPLVHLVRNALDHGIESPADRAAAGKPEAATLRIAARHAGGNVEITVADDGRGIDAAAVARKAVERGLLAPEAAATLDVRGAIELLFAPGFSTAEVTSDISGRGVGMDAVRTTIRDLGGEVVVNSVPGRGTEAQIRLPLTLAIMSTLLVEAAGRSFAIPLDRVERTLRIADHTVRSVAGQSMLIERDTVLPLIDAGAALARTPGGTSGHAVLVRSGDRRLALAVDRLVGQRELVTRPLPPEATGSVGVSGGAVLSDGSISLIVDCDAISSPAPTPAACAA
jgi:two-component system chemotaxis sensor kinase CheA